MDNVSQDRDEDSGQFTGKFEIEDFVEAVERLDNPTTKNVAESVGCSYDLAYRRLKSLKEKGEVDVVEVGGSFLWSRE